jgi:Protein of unknown function (DUF2612)
MVGPPYPRPNPIPGSNAIGTFQIGLSPIGDIPPFDPWTTIISQYADSPILDSYILAFNSAVDQTENLDNYYDMIWNVLTAVGYGLDVWGRIVGLAGGRTVAIPASAIAYLGFDEASGSWTGFGQGGFYSGGTLTNNFVLADADFRRLILAKAASNICSGSIQAINAILLALFPNRGVCYVADGQNMSLTYTFAFPLTAVDLAIIDTTGVLPNPAGVVVNISHP